MKKVVGYVDVDAGIIHVGDPCYTMAKGEDDPGVDYRELIDRLVDYDDVRLKLTPEQLKAIRDSNSAQESKRWPRKLKWDEPKLTSLAPPPEERDGVLHTWQAAYNPYTEEYAVGSPHNGAGLVIQSGYGDGAYPVEIEWDDSDYDYFAGVPDTTFEHDGETYVAEKGRPPMVLHRIKSVKITFISDEEEEGE